MRIINFRGKRIDNGEWVYGYFTVSAFCSEGTYWTIQPTPRISHKVERETVGQFTGLHDKNGKEIYEGDLLGYWTKDVNKKDKLLLCRVSFINGAFVADISKNLDGKLITDLSSYLDEYVVVGNIHENPELLTD